MSTKKVILYFEDESDALHFTVAASSLISNPDSPGSPDARKLIQPLTRAHRIRVGRSATHVQDAVMVSTSG
ncbi:MAG: hypothetical protein AB7O65_07905 [Candidatus Korobacteraceae bacterium]